MPFRPKPTLPSFSDLITSLNNSRNQIGDNPLYQTVFILIQRLILSQNNIEKQIKDTETLVNELLSASYLTVNDESAFLVNARKEVAGTGISFNDTTPHIRVVNATGGSGTVVGGNTPPFVVYDGEDGLDGFGVPGTQGAPGPIGPQGAASNTPGPPGLDGQDFEDAIQLPGIPGPQGAPGIQGTPGTPGTIGLDGLDGLDGIDGFPGQPGVQGIQGIPGNSGTIGPPGADGIDGEDGLIILTAGTSVIQASGYWAPLTDGNVDETDLIFASGEAVMVFVPV